MIWKLNPILNSPLFPVLLEQRAKRPLSAKVPENHPWAKFGRNQSHSTSEWGASASVGGIYRRRADPSPCTHVILIARVPWLWSWMLAVSWLLTPTSCTFTITFTAGDCQYMSILRVSTSDWPPERELKAMHNCIAFSNDKPPLKLNHLSIVHCSGASHDCILSSPNGFSAGRRMATGCTAIRTPSSRDHGQFWSTAKRTHSSQSWDTAVYWSAGRGAFVQVLHVMLIYIRIYNIF